MSLRKTLATAVRVLRQLRHDRRTVVLIFLVPCVLITILKYVFEHSPQLFDSIAPMILGIFPLIVMFVVTSVAMLRERTSGTLDRLMTMPLSKADLIFGYAIAFAVLAAIQAALASVVMLGFLGVHVASGAGPLLLAAVLAALLGTALGLFASAFARSEFQAVQFMPALILPQLLLCGLFVARDAMARPLQWLANVLPLTYSVDAMKQVAEHSSWTSTLTRDLIIVAAFAIVSLMIAAVTIRRQD